VPLREPPKEFDSSVAKLVQMQHETWLHYVMFAIILSNSTPLFSSFFILISIAIMCTHVLLFALMKRTPFAAAWFQKLDHMVEHQIPFLEVAISLGLIVDLFTPYRSLLATVMYFWVFLRQRVTPIPMHVFQPTIFRQPKFAASHTRKAWSKVDEMIAPQINKLPIVKALYPKIVQLAAKFADPQGVAGRQ
jgi:hypothetical protein